MNPKEEELKASQRSSPQKPKLKRRKKESTRSPLHGLINDRPHITAIVGKKNSGKSTMARNLLLDKRGFKKKYTRIIFVSPTFVTQFESLWKKISKEGVTVYEDVSDRLLATILAQQMEDPEPTLLIFDDIADALRHSDQAVLNRLCCNSRQIGLSIVILAQRITLMPTVLRSQTDCWICFQSMSYLECEALYREMSVVNKKEFMEIFRKAVERPYGFFIDFNWEWRQNRIASKF
jgi:hypothetical protein